MPPWRSTRRSRGAVFLALAILATLWLHPGPAAAAAIADSWSPVGTFRTPDGWYASPVHATILPDGRIFFVGVAHPTDPPDDANSRRVAWMFTPPPPGATIPATTVITELNEPGQYNDFPSGPDWTITDNFICMGAVLDAQGRVVTAGGTRQFRATNGTGWIAYGLPYLSMFDGTTWARSKAMAGAGRQGTPARWYPTLTRLPSGKILITGGWEVINNQDGAGQLVAIANSTIETFDPTNGAQQVLSTNAQSPLGIHASDYAHVFVLPWPGATKDLLVLGEQGRPVFGRSTTTGSFQEYPIPRPGPADLKPGYGMSSLMLPLRQRSGEWGYRNGAVMTVGGNMHTAYEHTADVFDPNTAAWRTPSIDLTTNRHHPSTVLLPDGRILVVNGHDMDGDTGVMRAQYIDPRNNFAVSTGASSSGVVRGYHSVAVLLPDGRVLTAGGRDQDRETTLEKPTWQIYTPTYPAGTAPMLVGTPSQVGYGASFQVSSLGAAPKEMQLIGLASMTHSIDMGQREIQLAITRSATNAAGASLSVVTAPDNAHVAPPGYYWLVGVSADGVPSTAKVVRIG